MNRGVRLVRRTTVRCPHGRGVVGLCVEMSPTGRPACVLCCSGAAGHPPGCDQACVALAELVLAPVESLLILAPGAPIPEEPDRW